MSHESLTQDELKRVMDYDPNTGVFTRRVRTSNKVRVGDVAGCKNSNGYWQMWFGGTLCYAHCLAWLYVYGEWQKQLDHINGNRNDNRIANLRVVTTSENHQNRRGVKGCFWNTERRRWQARIHVNKTQIHLGFFTTESDARAAYLAAKKIHHPTSPINV